MGLYRGGHPAAPLSLSKDGLCRGGHPAAHPEFVEGWSYVGAVIRPPIPSLSKDGSV